MAGRTYRLIISYDGTKYRGWQRLADTPLTIQGKLEASLTKIFGQPIEIDGSGRTDAGVHALRQVASFHAPEKNVDNVLAQLRHSLPEDIGAVALEYAEDRFHARFNAVKKTYIYRIWNSSAPDVFQRRYRTQFPQRLNLDAMKEAMSLLEGTHDFLAFCSNKHLKKSSVRTLYSMKLEQTGEEICFVMTADGFLYNMARIMVGTLLEIGLGKKQVQDIPFIFESRIRENAGETAPAKGLCLMEVEYQ